MSSVGFIDIDIVGNKRSVQAMLEHLDSAFSDIGMRLFLTGRIAPWLRERVESRFQDEGDDATGKWKPLSEASQSWRAHGGFGPTNPINKRTGQLEDFLTSAPSTVITSLGFAQLAYPEGPPADKITARKLRTAQRGSDNPSTGARPVLGLGEADLTYVLTQLALHIQGWDRRVE